MRKAKTKMPVRQPQYRSKEVWAYKAAANRSRAYSPQVKSAVIRPVRQPHQHPWGFIKLATTCLIIIAAVVYYGGFSAHHLRVHANTASPKVAKVSTERITQLNNTINGLINSAPDDTISVLATDVSTGQSVSYGSNASYTAASTAKLLSAVYLLHLTETHQESLTENIEGSSAHDLLNAMIVNSDDTAWQAINDKLTHNGLTSYSASIGFTDYDVADNIMPATDIQLILTKLYRGQLLNKTDTHLLLGEMQQANFRDYIVAGAPNGDTVYHKAGLIDDNIHDAGIITKGNHALVVTIFTDGNGTYDSVARTTLMQRITSELTAAFLP